MKKIITLLCIAFLITWMIPKAFLVRIAPWEIGVRRSLTSGIAEQDFDFGYNFALPMYHSYYRLPRTLRYLEYNDGDKSAQAGSLEVRTSGNNIIYVDVAIPWRVKPGEAWQIVRKGFLDTYPVKVQSVTTGVLRETLAEMSNLDIYHTDKRIETANRILPRLNEQLAQYHVVAERVIIRAIRFRPEYEEKLQNKQYYVVQARLDGARTQESIALQSTDTLEKTIEKDIALKREEWNEKIEVLRTKFEIEISTIEAEAVRYDRLRRSEADAAYARAHASGDLAEAKAEALGEKLKAEALASRAGRTFSAILAVENFELGDIELNSNDPTFLMRFGSMKAWRQFFLGE